MRRHRCRGWADRTDRSRHRRQVLWSFRIGRRIGGNRILVRRAKRLRRHQRAVGKHVELAMSSWISRAWMYAFRGCGPSATAILS